MIGIRCPVCGSAKLRVIDKRAWDGGVVRRRRECEAGHRFATSETVVSVREDSGKWVSK